MYLKKKEKQGNFGWIRIITRLFDKTYKQSFELSYCAVLNCIFVKIVE